MLEDKYSVLKQACNKKSIPVGLPTGRGGRGAEAGALYWREETCTVRFLLNKSRVQGPCTVRSKLNKPGRVSCIMGNGHMGPPSPGQTDKCTTENITFQQLHWRAVIMSCPASVVCCIPFCGSILYDSVTLQICKLKFCQMQSKRIG